jgi:hypothetical protein
VNSKLTMLPQNRAIVLRNETCPYCGRTIQQETRTKEHVVGRRFVPRGSLDQHWNLILWTCEPCNQRKAALEDDLSAISMHSGLTGQHARDDVRLREDAARKARRSISQRTRKPVADSHEQFSIKMSPAAGVEFTFNMTSGPQADEARVIELVRLQVMGFFYWITIQPGEVNGQFWPGSYFPLTPVRRSDWGNEQQKFFMNLTVDWDPLVHAITAEGYFKLAIKKHPDHDAWSFAVEWNESYRTVGFFGDTEALYELRDRVPSLLMETIWSQGTDFLRYRREVPLSDKDDILFDMPAKACRTCRSTRRSSSAPPFPITRT